MCPKSTEPILFVELIPKSCHYSNVRTSVKPKEWDKIRFISYEKAGHKCEICKNTGKKQGYKHDVECHEIWEYDDIKHVQKLVGLISLCPVCHQVKHIGRAMAIGKEKDCYEQLAKVNGWTKEQIDKHIEESFDVYKERSKHEWTLDLSLLKEEPYELKIKSGKRIFEVRKYKKKKKGRAKKRIKLKKRPSRYKK